MDTHSSDDAPHGDDVGRSSPPYPLTRTGLELWLRRGEQLGRAACWVAAAHRRAAKGPSYPPPAPV